MTTLKYLYYFSSPSLDIVEIKRSDLKEDASLSDIYKWLVIRKKAGKVWELDFKAMDKLGEEESRTFLEGSLKFDSKKAIFSIFQDEIILESKNANAVPFPTKELIETYLSRTFETTSLFHFRELKPSDLQFFKNWIFDKEVIRYSMTKFHRISSLDQVTSWFASIMNDPGTFQLGITDPMTGKLIGYAGIASLNEIDKNGEYFIFIGDKDYWGRGIASEVTKKIVEHGFLKLNLHRIFLTASNKNTGAIKAYEKAGFKIEGQMREAFYRNNEYSDKVIMGILKSEFKV